MSIEEVIRNYSDMVYRLAFAKCGNAHDAEDITQEVFLKLHSLNKRFENEEHRKAWLIRVAVNAGKNVAMSAVRRRTAADDVSEHGYIGEKDKNLSRLETEAVVLPAVMSLPEKERMVIHLFYYEDMPISEICSVLGANENTVKSRLHRAKARLKEKLKEVDFSE